MEGLVSARWTGFTMSNESAGRGSATKSARGLGAETPCRQINLSRDFSFWRNEIYVDPLKGNSLSVDFSSFSDPELACRAFVAAWEDELERRWQTADCFDTNWGLINVEKMEPGIRYASRVFGHRDGIFVRVVLLVVQCHGATFSVYRHVCLHRPMVNQWLWPKVKWLVLASPAIGDLLGSQVLSPLSTNPPPAGQAWLYAQLSPFILGVNSLLPVFVLCTIWDLGPSSTRLSQKGDLESISQHAFNAAVSQFGAAVNPSSDSRASSSNHVDGRYEVE